MQGSDIGYMLTTLFENLLCKISRGCMRNGIMYVHQSQIVILYDAYHGANQRRLVWWKVKQWISRYRHLMKIHAGSETVGQSYRLLISYEVHFMIFICGRYTELGCYYADTTN